MHRFHRWNLEISRFIVLVALIVCSTELFAQQSVQVIWPLTNDAESIYTSGIGHTAFKHGTSLTNFRFDSINGATSGGWNSRDLNKQAYFEYSLTPEQDAEITITQLKFEVSLSSVNMRTAVHYSKDGFTNQSTPIGNTVYVGKRSSRDLLVETSIRVKYPETLSIRIYGWSAPNAAVNFFARDVEFNGVVSTEKEETPAEISDEGGGDRSTATLTSTNLPGPSGNFVVPANVYNLTVECWGGGGGGSNVGLASAGGGGGGGAYAASTFAVSPGQSFPYVIGSAGNVGVNGGSTNFNTGQVVAEGGRAGNAGGNGGLGGNASASSGDIKYSGGRGGDMESALTSGGGGGAAASSSGNGANGNNGAGGIGGAGGVGVGVAGSGGHGGNTNNAITVTVGGIPGGGGGGAGLNTNSRAGGVGRITVTYCVSPTIVLSPVPAVCYGSSTANLPYTSTTESPTHYRIDYNPAAESAGFVDVTDTPLPASPIVLSLPVNVAVATYTGTIYVRNADCSSVGYDFTIQVKALPVAVVTNNAATICSGSNTNIQVSGALTTAYTWTMTPINVNGNLSGSGTLPLNSTISQTLTTQTANIGTATYYITPTGNGCIGTTVSTIVNVNPNPSVEITPNPQTICSGQSTALTLSSNVTGTSFSWTVVPVNVTGATDGSGGTTIDQILTSNPSNVTGTATYTVTGTAAGCSSVKNVVVTVRPVPTFTVTPLTQNSCPGAAITPITISTSNGVPSTNYTWDRTDVPQLSGIGLTGNSMPINGVFNSTTPGTLLTTTFTITATANGCSSNATATATVGDITAPNVTCPVSGQQNVTTNSGCTYKHSGTPNWDASATDNCSVVSVLYTLSGATAGTGSTLTDAIFNLGITTVTWTATDIGGNTATCSFTVNVTDDDKPVFTFCPGNQNVNTDLNLCTYTHSGTGWDATASDNCSGAVTLSYNLTGVTSGTGTTLSGVVFNKGVTTITWTATDVAGNSISTCVFTVTVVDNQLPVISCPGNQTRAANNGTCTYTVVGTEFNPLSYSDNCPGSTIVNDFNNLATLAGAVLPQGVTNISWTVTAANGQTAICSFSVTITDNQPPTIVCPGNISQNTGVGSTSCGRVVSWPPATGFDNCGNPVTVTCSPVSGSFFPVGTTTVTCTGTDGSFNTGTCTFTVTIIDNTLPTFNAPANTAVNTNSSCGYNIDPSITLFPTLVNDNCGIQSTTYSDGPLIPTPPCTGNYTVVRTWTVTDVNGNSTSKPQTITIQDKTAPLWATFPPNMTVDCADPVSTYGVPTVTDNCDVNPSVTKVDATVPDPNCPSGKTITRTWTATDCSGNSVSRIQIIIVDDNIPPVIDNTGNTVVNCPKDIPPPNPNAITAHDNCGPVTIIFDYDYATFPPEAPGYCPDSVYRYFNVYDACGNKTVAIQEIDILDPLSTNCKCKQCLSNNSFWEVDLRIQPVITIVDVAREDKCCNANKQEWCISFSVYIPIGAVGVQILVDGGHPNGQGGGNNFWKVDCEEVEFLDNDYVCLPGGQYYLFTYCKPGQNENNTFTFGVLQGIVSAPDITARVSCNSQLTTNTTATSVTWNSIWPGTYGQYNGYLSCTNCNNPIFTPDENAPNIIQYQVCGTMADMPCFGVSGTACDTITIEVHDSISVTFNIDPGAYCRDEIPPITATVNPSGTTYELYWYKLPDTTNVLGTGYTFLPPSAGDYMLKIHDTDEGVPCPNYYYYFTVAPDNDPPVVTAPPALELECEDPAATSLITQWLALATATDDHDPSITVENDYTGINQDCNVTLTVTFSATDQCDNIGYGYSTITILDRQEPIWMTGIGDLDRTLECTDAAGLAAAQLLEPYASDLCDEDVDIIKTSGVLVPGSCPQSGTITNTWTGVDDCGNSTATVYTQTITITDATAPTWTTIAGDLNRNVTCNDAAGLAAAQALVPTATDICDPSVTVTKTSGSQVPGVCPTIYTITNTFIATDDCGNISTVYTQVITVNDIVPPVINTQPSNLTVECDGTGNLTDLNNWLNNHGGATATDLCDANLTWTSNFTALSDDCGATGAATVIFTAADDCNNSVSTNAVTFTIVDTQLPTIVCPPNVTAQINTINCTVDNVDLGTATGSDACSGVTITNNAPAEFPAGITIVTWTASDACGNAITCQQTVTVQDIIPPTVDCPVTPITVNADPGSCDAYIEVPAPVVTDPCPYTMTNDYTGTSSAFATYPVGTTTIIWTITGDISGAESFCTQVVNVIDNQSPTITCPGDQLFTAPAPACTLVMTAIPDPTYSDNCQVVNPPVLSWVLSGATTGSGTGSVNGTTFNVGTTTVEYTVTDAAGLTDVCQFNVVVNDAVPPTVITCPGNQTWPNIPGECFANVTVPLPEVIDPCGEIVSYTNSFNGTTNASGQYPVGATLVVWTFVDNSGNESYCQHTITVNDTELPTIICPGDASAIAQPPDCSVPNLVIDDPVIDDNCPDPVLTWIKTGATTGSGSGLINNTPFNVGVTIVRYIITDAAGNSAWCEFTVTISDEVPPTITDCPDNIVVPNEPGECYANVIVPLPDVDDPCGEIVTITNSFNGTGNASGQYPIGITTVVWTFTDESGNAVTCSHTVTVNDDEYPTITCPDDITALAPPPDCILEDVILELPVYDDNCPGYTVTWAMTGATIASGSGTITQYDFEVGVTTLIYTITDASGNITTCDIIITINDDVPPTVIDCPDDITQNADPDACNTYINTGIPVVDDPCDEIVTISHDSPVGTPTDPSGYYDVGVHVITWTFTDESGNFSTCVQTITVVDNQDPVFTFCPADVIAEATPPDCEVPDIVLGIPIYEDNCPGYVLTYTMTGAVTGSGNGLVGLTTFPVGTTQITYTVTDASGNTAICQFFVIVRDDVPPTVITCPPDQDVYPALGSCEAQVNIPLPVVEDPCEEIVSITHNSLYGTPADPSGIYPVGVYNITWTFTDESGNTSTCLQVIRVIDEQLPEIDCPDNIEQELINGDCELADVVIPNPTFTDNCNVVTLQWETEGATVLSSPPTGMNYFTDYTLNVGVTTVIYTAIDPSGNIATCSFTVWIKDLTPLFHATCPANVTVPSDADRCGADVSVPQPIIDNPCNEAFTVTNNSPYADDNASGYYPVGTTTVHWIITDASGNVTPCDQLVTVTDLSPVLLCPPDQTVDADYEKPYATGIVLGSPTFGDNCGIASLTWIHSATTPGSSPLTGINIDTTSIFNVGTTTITYTVTDINGNVTSCQFTITVMAEPVIECPADINTTTDPGVCSATLDPGYPVKVSGVEPITWTWIITDESGTQIGTGTCSPTAALPGCLGIFTFPVGINTITWTATNISGTTSCIQTVNVVDDEPPTYDVPVPFELCVNQIITAKYDGAPEPGAGIMPINPADGNPRRPDWYEVASGSTELDLLGLLDNCCALEDINISWTIDFDPITGYPSISGTGQPSLSTPIYLWGTYTNVNVTHFITYIISDCNGNAAAPIVRNLLITPRPDIIKQY